MSTLTKLDPDFESPAEEAIRRCREAVAFHEVRATDPTRLSADRATHNAKANAYRAHLRELLNPPTPTEEDEDDE